MADDLFDELLAEAVHEPVLLLPGEKLADGRFVVRTLLGTGGLGAVYQATDTRRGIDVAIKVLAHVDAAGIYGIKQEFRSLSDVAHPNLVVLHELYTDRGMWFFTMELVAGAPLSKMESFRRSVFGQIADAIHAIHSHGKLHRDLKPSNVMVTPAGRVVVLDFGLVSDQRPGGVGRTLAEEGLSGTPTYMAPEQVTDSASPESDWYAFGTMLYEALFSDVPFRGSGVGLLVRKREQPAEHPGGDVPEDLADLCLRLLDRDAASRPGYPEIVSALGRTASGDLVVDPKTDPFVGRTAELDALEQAMIEADAGQSAVVTVSGVPGIGKTRMVERFLDTVTDRGGVVLSGRCPKWEHVPLPTCDSLIDGLSRYLRTLPIERAASLLPRTTPALTRLFPVLDRLPAVKAIKQRRALPKDPGTLRRLGAAALRELMVNIAAQEQLVVFVDDMQWSDIDGARLLASLVAPGIPSDEPAMLLVIAHRPQDAEACPGLVTFLDRVASIPDVKLELQELSASESHQLAVQLLERRDGTEERIANDAAGNPLLIGMMARYVLASDTVSQVDFDRIVLDRLATLAVDERDTLEAICLTGHPVSLGILAQVSTHDPEPLVRNLVTAHLARFAAGLTDTVTAYHERIREAVVSTLEASERQRLHTRFVEVLEKATDPDPMSLTLHYLGCGRQEEAAACAVTAAGRAVSVLAFEQAAAMYLLALSHKSWQTTQRIDLLVHLAEALVLDRRSGEAGQRFLQAAELETDHAVRRARRLRAADQYLAGGWLHEGVDLMREILAEVGLDYDEICRSDLFELRKRLAMSGLQIKPRSEREIEPATLARLEALRVAGSGMAWLKPYSVQFRFVLALEALEAGEPMRFAMGLRTVARFDAQLNPDNDEVYRVVRQICDDNPGFEADLIRPGLETGMAFVRGRPWDQYKAAHRTEEVLLQHPTQDARVLSVARYHMALALFLQGEVHELHPSWEWLTEAEDRNDLFLSAWLNAMLASQLLARGRPDVARRMCSKALRMWSAVDEAEDSALRLCCDDVLSNCDVYEEDVTAYEKAKTATRWLDRSNLRFMPLLVCFRHFLLARSALACAHQEYGLRREALLQEAEASIKSAEQPFGLDGRMIGLPHFQILSTLLSASLATLRGDDGAALTILDRGLEQMDRVESYALRSAHARRAKGVLLGLPEGNAMVDEAEANLQKMGVGYPAQHARTVVPGLSDLKFWQTKT